MKQCQVLPIDVTTPREIEASNYIEMATVLTLSESKAEWIQITDHRINAQETRRYINYTSIDSPSIRTNAKSFNHRYKVILSAKMTCDLILKLNVPFIHQIQLMKRVRHSNIKKFHFAPFI